MPLAAELNVPRPGVEVDVSAVVDLYVFISGCDKSEGQRRPELAGNPELAERLLGFWGEGSGGYGSFDELLVLAALGGSLAGVETVTGLLAALPGLAARPSVPLTLRTEQEDTRERVVRHLDLLREDADRRARYVELIAEAAAAVSARWLERLPRLQARVAWYRGRLAEGEDLVSLLPGRHLALLPRYRRLFDEALRNGRALLVPTVTSDVIYDLPGVLLIGARLPEDDPTEAARRRTAKIAERLRPLGDPTRLAMAAYLSGQPASVSGLARAFGLAQPTVSAHVRSLRGAGLLDSNRAHGMTEFRLAERRVADLFADAQKALFDDE